MNLCALASTVRLREYLKEPSLGSIRENKGDVLGTCGSWAREAPVGSTVEETAGGGACNKTVGCIMEYYIGSSWQKFGGLPIGTR